MATVVLVVCLSALVFWIVERYVQPDVRRCPVIWAIRFAGLWLVACYAASAGAQSISSLERDLARNQAMIEAITHDVEALQAVQMDARLAVLERQAQLHSADLDSLSMRSWGILVTLLTLLGSQVLQIKLSYRVAHREERTNDRRH